MRIASLGVERGNPNQDTESLELSIGIPYGAWIPRLDWEKEKEKYPMITLGIDVGSLTTKALVLEDSNILSSSLLLTGDDASDTTAGAVSQSLE